MTGKKSMIIVSNRLPVQISITEEDISVQPSVGGLATGMKSVYQEHPGIWIGWPGIASDDIDDTQRRKIDRLLDKEGCAGVDLNAAEIDDYYYGFTNRTIWPLFHYFTQYTEFDQTQWQAYVEVNRKFADKVVEHTKPGDTLWIHDYHLLLLPRMVRERVPDVTIGFFLHIPFPSYEIFRTMPWREEIIRGMLGADLVGFHTYDYERHFLSCVRRLAGCDIEINRISVESRYVRAEVFPMGIDYERFHNAALAITQKRETVKSQILSEIETYASVCSGCRLILSIDRLDYTKGIPNRLKAFELFLEKYPQYHKQVSLIMLTVPSRTNVNYYQQLKSEIDEIVGRINGRYRSINWTPIWYFYRSMPFEDLIALYASSDIALLTPLRDGMNLVAKEYIASRVNSDGVLILSEMTGASKEMGEALIINPNDIEQTAEAIRLAVSMEQDVQRESVTRISRRLSRYDVRRWAADFIGALERASSDNNGSLSLLMSVHNRQKLADAFLNAKRRILFLDYDGTLQGFFANPADAFPDEELLALLGRIAALPSTDLVITTGRAGSAIEGWFDATGASLITEHGLRMRKKGQDWEESREFSSEWKGAIRQLMEFYVDRTPGCFVEEKSYALVWHYRKADPEMGPVRARELREELMSLVSSDKNLELLEGNRVIEVKVNGYNKGIASERFMFNDKYDFIMAIGDDVTDEYMFEHMPAEAVTIKVGISPSKAQYRLKNPADVRVFLAMLADSISVKH